MGELSREINMGMVREMECKDGIRFYTFNNRTPSKCLQWGTDANLKLILEARCGLLFIQSRDVTVPCSHLPH